MWPITSSDGNGQANPVSSLEIRGKIRCEIWIWTRISGLIIILHPAASSALSDIQWNQKKSGLRGGGGGRRWREEGRGERKKGVREEESRDQSIVWDYVCSDNILHPTHCSLSGCFTAAVSDSQTQLHTHTHTKAPSLIPCTPIRIMPLAKFTPSSAATVSKCD